jgi:phenylalanyl-tRNA synthetase beta chain
MQFSHNWLAAYVELPETFETLAEGLTGAGLAVEGITRTGDDIYFDVDVTSNRPDCMSHLGLAREVSAVFGTPVKLPETPAPGSVKIESNSWGSITIEDPDGCPRYVGVLMRGVRVGPSPDWLKTRLKAVGVRTINNVVDVTNFVLWEFGQPLHAFDADKLRGERIVVRSAHEGEILTTLDEEERRLDSEVLVIADAEGAVALAGIMGGRDSEVTGASVNVLIESAYFEPARVRNGAKKLGLHTDASHRFERGSDFEGCLEAALRAAALIKELSGGEVDPDAIDVRPAMTEPLWGTLSLAELHSFAGVDIDADFVVEKLQRLGFTLQKTDEGEPAWSVQVPSWRRHDFETDPSGHVYPAYFYEEVLRMLGLDAIPSTLPAIGGPDQGSGRSHRHRENLRGFLAATGMAETVTYWFGSDAADRRVENLVAGPPRELANALSEQYAFLRRSLLPNLVEGALFNLRREAQAVRLFEFGHLFPGEGAEVDALGIILGGTLGSPWRRGVTLDFFDLKGIFEELSRARGVVLEFEPCEITGFVSGTGAEASLV